ncbi:MAG: hypothetical protein AB7R89_16360 [Dehalococcoidia bacterium]
MSYWETRDRDPSITEYEREFAHLWKCTPKVVFSKSLGQVEGNATPALPPLNHQLNLRLVDSRTFRSGVVYLAYQRAGERRER